jgi:hypothetical protein
MPGLVFRKRLNHRSTQLQKDAALMQYCQHPGAGLEVYQPETMSRKKRKDLWRQFHEKPSIIPGCPGRNHEYGAHDKDTVHQCPQQLTRQTSLCCPNHMLQALLHIQAKYGFSETCHVPVQGSDPLDVH